MSETLLGLAEVNALRGLEAAARGFVAIGRIRAEAVEEEIQWLLENFPAKPPRWYHRIFGPPFAITTREEAEKRSERRGWMCDDLRVPSSRAYNNPRQEQEWRLKKLQQIFDLCSMERSVTGNILLSEQAVSLILWAEAQEV
jgi:hypothetical protein